ncbi:MAG: sigma-54-dependent Fis family transcriptional regulator, partial [Flavobacteriales bacterium]|nr:sigma-54-dependent Fis family transcriptional regulator [Flavobacteriales bacterium]
MMKVQQAKQRFGIIGNSVLLDRSINIALQVAPTDISVFVSGESGTGKESIPKIIHQASKRKHNNYIAVNCGAIPEGTIDSELFGHEKGSFTGAHDSRKGYFEVADGGTIFLDEVAELPLSTQVRLLRVLESGEFIKVGSSTPIKINVRVIAATNINIPQAIKNGKFREDLYYRLNTVSIFIPSLRERKEDISLLFRKFASDFSEQYNTPSIRLDEEAMDIITNYNWPGNIRQLKNFVSQLSVIEKERNISAQTILDSLPENKNSSNTPILFEDKNKADLSEREILYKVLFDMKRDLTELKKITFDLMKKDGETETTQVFNDLSENEITLVSHDTTNK